MNGVDPEGHSLKKQEVQKILTSLKYLQRYEPETDETTRELRKRNYETFVKDPFGE